MMDIDWHFYVKLCPSFWVKFITLWTILIYRVYQNRCNPLIRWFIFHPVIFHLSLKRRSYLFRKVKPDKSRNWLAWYYSARERPSSSESLCKDFLEFLPTKSLTSSTLSGHLLVNFLPYLGFSASLLNLWFEVCVLNEIFCFSRDNC